MWRIIPYEERKVGFKLRRSLTLRSEFERRLGVIGNLYRIFSKPGRCLTASIRLLVTLGPHTDGSLHFVIRNEQAVSQIVKRLVKSSSFLGTLSLHLFGLVILSPYS
uniref:Uncharacterized protein n=1 Tax=Ombrophytum subterraneum TaxID=50155 RepID=A0A6M8PL32_9MAGN|nr:hypothetical protein [Ombrophytum subterraneum]